MITFYFLRHGQTTWNLSGKYQGSTDVPLSELGIRQAALAARWFDGMKIDAIYSSPQIRARRTAEALVERQGMQVELVPEFRELCFGDWEGLTYDEIESRWPGAVERMYQSPDTVRIPNGESFDEVQTRTMSAMRKIMARGNDKTYVIVSHGASIRTILCGMLGISLHAAWQFCQANANISCIHCYGEDKNWLYLLNSQEHLRELPERN